MFDRVKVIVEKSSLDSLQEVCAGGRWGVLRLLVFGAIGAALGASIWISFFFWGWEVLTCWGSIIIHRVFRVVVVIDGG